jgi:hypothetical protein
MLLLLIAAAWFAVGALAVVAMHRRGHDVFSWVVLFLFLGPLAIPLAVSADRHPPPEPDRPAGPGALDILVSHDGSAQADAALDCVLALCPNATSLTLAAVVDLEAPTTAAGRDTIDEAHRRLSQAAHRVERAARCPVHTVVLHGEPARTLESFAAEHTYQLIVAANGNAGAHAHRGFVRRLAASSAVPVLLGPSAVMPR